MLRVPRRPKSCPPGFLGRYRVATGDTLGSIARFFRRPLSQLKRANPHIKNPDQLFPGDILCVPGNIPFPCGVPLKPLEPVPAATEGLAFVHIVPQGGQAVSLVAILPPVRHWGNYNQYQGQVVVGGGAGTFSRPLFQASSEEPSWFTTISLPTVVSLMPNTQVRILPSNSVTGAKGPVIMQGRLGNCLRPGGGCRNTKRKSKRGRRQQHRRNR